MVIILPEPKAEKVNVTALTWLPDKDQQPAKFTGSLKRPKVLVLTDLVASYYLVETYCSGVIRN